MLKVTQVLLLMLSSTFHLLLIYAEILNIQALEHFAANRLSHRNNHQECQSSFFFIPGQYAACFNVPLLS